MFVVKNLVSDSVIFESSLKSFADKYLLLVDTIPSTHEVLEVADVEESNVSD
jgi:hypothetical protein